MSSSPRNRGPKSPALPSAFRSPRRGDAPCPKRRSRRAADRAPRPAQEKSRDDSILPHWFAVAKQKGYRLLGRGARIYLFRIELVDRPVLKLGHSSDPERRLFQQLGPAARDTGEVQRAIDMETGHAALVAEKRAHRTMWTEHPEWVVPPEVFAGQINTKSEIYEIEALEFLLSLMDEIEAEAHKEKASASDPEEPDPEPD